jgi:DNA-binding GntR family transcriptional regulator
VEGTVPRVAKQAVNEVSIRGASSSRSYSTTGGRVASDEGARVSRPADQSKSQRAYAWIKERIADGSYSPGYRLVLGTIAKELDVSVVPVREAIRLLEAEGLVTFERNVGAQVTMVEKTEYLYTMQTLGVVEGAATGLAAAALRQALRDGRGRPPQDGAQGPTDAIARARAINAQMIECLHHFEPHRFTQLNLEFHSVLFEHCPNPHILDLVHRGWNRLNVLRDSTFSFVPGRARESVDEHEALLKLIENGAAPLDIELAARAHRQATLDAFLAHQAEREHPHDSDDNDAEGDR